MCCLHSLEILKGGLGQVQQAGILVASGGQKWQESML